MYIYKCLRPATLLKKKARGRWMHHSRNNIKLLTNLDDRLLKLKIYFILYKTYCLPKERSDHALRSKFQASTLPLMKY